MAKKNKIVSRRNNMMTFMLFLVAFGLIGIIGIITSYAAPSATTGTIQLDATATLQEPLNIHWSYSKSPNQLKRPFIEVMCYRDVNNDSTINTSGSSSPDMVYATHNYLFETASNDPSFIYEVTQSRGGYAGVARVTLLSGLNRLIMDAGPAVCNATLQEWGTTSYRNQTVPFVYAKSMDVALTDNRQ